MRWGWCLSIFMLMVLHGFYHNLQNRIGTYLWNQMKNKQLPPTQCAAIRHAILHKSLKRIKAQTFRKYMNDLQKCPWKYKESAHNLLRLQFGSCCDAVHRLVVTQENTPLGLQMQYETNPKNVTIDETIFKMLPQVSPFSSKPLDTCAIVGNGGILQNSFCGREIDKADYVFRFNLPPMTITDDIGTKADIVSANPSIFSSKFHKLYERRRPFIDLVKDYNSAMILLPAFSYKHNMDVSFRVLHTIQDFDLPNKVIFFHPGYLRNISMYWRKKGLKVKRLSTGLMLVSAAIELCKKITLYGFWPFSQDPEGHNIPHHYYDNKVPKPGFHSMPEEFYFYTKMHFNGVLHLKVGHCS
ncbi:alpha-2,8-sialyltransferase 8F-like [Anomaloglossus baeobatrachus]|uniref:alpha-2,8-sialyltransferase 8F-like n=1 Tax=Anomaloglossus baeobatrachus TaxID=238106 RepID=UPI003F5011CE